MPSAKLRITKLYIENGFLQIEVSASNGVFMSTIDTYLNFEELEEFGRKLRDFGQSIKDEVILEVGADNDDAYHYLFLRVYIYDNVGHEALQVKMRRNGEPVVRATADFSMPTEIASLNRLGKNISEWNYLIENTLEHPFSFDLYNP